ncbi:Wound-induced protein [Macleaya cordata]|uniref:Wound-induced protein n=1 Tax=Macleaya cordata TaxID=56857 RepID=A0A200QQH7_MACCD|nr:Wound-induced protein [Macleaya cordata]
MMRLLTGTDSSVDASFLFVPLSITSLGSTVLVEGCDQNREIFWVHAWTVSDHGIITQVREYFNTSLTVTHFGSSNQSTPSASPSPSSSSSSSSPPSSSSSSSYHCSPLWQSRLSNSTGKSMPGFVLAI